MTVNQTIYNAAARVGMPIPWMDVLLQALNTTRMLPGEQNLVVNQNYPVGYAERYGALGDGVTDDTEAILNAYTAAVQTGLRTVTFTGGKTYVCSKTIDIRNNSIQFVNPSFDLGYDGIGSSTAQPYAPALIRFNGALAIGIDAGANNANFFRMVGLSLDGQGVAGTTCLLRLGGTSQIIAGNVFGAAADNIILSPNANGLFMSDVASTWATGYGLRVGRSTVSLIQNCRFRRNGTARGGGGVFIDNAQGVEHLDFESCVFESNNNNGLYILNDTKGTYLRNVHFKNCWFEANARLGGTYEILIDATAGDSSVPVFIDFEECSVDAGHRGVYIKKGDRIRIIKSTLSAKSDITIDAAVTNTLIDDPDPRGPQTPAQLQSQGTGTVVIFSDSANSNGRHLLGGMTIDHHHSVTPQVVNIPGNNAPRAIQDFANLTGLFDVFVSYPGGFSGGWCKLASQRGRGAHILVQANLGDAGAMSFTLSGTVLRAAQNSGRAIDYRVNIDCVYG